MGPNHIKFNSFFELSYLHPNYFNLSKSINYFNLNENYIIVRFIAWKAFHDKGQLGIPDKMKKYVISELSKYSKVYISSEDSLPKELNKYKLNIRPKRYPYY